MTQLVTSAGNLLAWADRLRPVLNSVDPAIILFEAAFAGPAPLTWTYGLRSFERLIARTRADVLRSDMRTDRYLETLDGRISQFVRPSHLVLSGEKLLSSALDPQSIERLEALDDALRLQGLATSASDAAVAAVIAEIGDILSGLDGCEPGSVEDFISIKLRELAATVEGYAFYGAGGVEHAVKDLVAEYLAARLVSPNLPEPLKLLGYRIAGLSKVALDLIVYSKDVADGIAWVGTQWTAVIGPSA